VYVRHAELKGYILTLTYQGAKRLEAKKSRGQTDEGAKRP